MTTTTVFRPRLVQHGTFTFSVPNFVWTDFEVDIGAQTGTQTYAISSGIGYSQVYDFDLTFDAERGLPLDPPNIFTRTGEAFVLTLETDLTSAPDGWILYFSNTTAQQLWSTNDTPGNPVNSALLQIIETIPDTSPFWQLNTNGTTYDLVYPIDLNTLYGARPPVSIQNNFRSTRWNGRFAISFQNIGSGSLLVRDPTAYANGFFQVQSVPQYTGWADRPAELGRPVPDMRTGFPSFAQNLVEDAYQDGIWTAESQWDPDDPRNIRQVEFPPDESVKDDDVPV